MDLVREINRLLEEKQKRLTAKRNVAD